MKQDILVSSTIYRAFFKYYGGEKRRYNHLGKTKFFAIFYYFHLAKSKKVVNYLLTFSIQY